MIRLLLLRAAEILAPASLRQVTLIDFPQMISTSHTNADYYFNRDVECVRAFFRRRFGLVATHVPTLDADTSRNEHALDEQLAASGWTPAQETEFAALADALAEEQAAERAEHDRALEQGSEAGEGVGSEDGSDGETSSSGDGEDSGEGDDETMGPERRQLNVSTGSDGDLNISGRAAFGVAGATLGTADVEDVASQVKQSLRTGVAAEAREHAPAEFPTADCSRGASGSAAGGAYDGSTLGDEECSTAGVSSCGAGRGSEAHELTHSPCATAAEEELLHSEHNRAQPVHQGQSRNAGEVLRSEPARGCGPGRAMASEVNVRVAERVKQELRRKHSLRQPKGGSRNEAKNREQRKLAASVRREVDGSGGW
jgi:serine/threonine-protein kinase RIO1